jgi:hypothetical protein
VGNCEQVGRGKFPASANFAANFSRLRHENLKLCPESAESAAHSGNGAANPGNFALMVSSDSSYISFAVKLEVASREKATNPGHYCAMTNH